ncbi:hypothetical protein IWQ60_001477 [Tieghemiomyces parasiticus]|uniref:DUF3020 domain-containing protein n=1 Tax=Tieghemiomyces parasiticus TaxID=78921 RepID=A0A9W8AJ95_9FUNG|nr:hypothetical protein IWQ60_001477 [Tieghemiomyces parasiticus]
MSAAVATAASTTPSGSRSKPRSKADVCERMRRWRAENVEKNRENDMRCRVYRLARQQFGPDDTEEKRAWIQTEIARRTERRRLRESTKSDSNSNAHHQLQPLSTSSCSSSSTAGSPPPTPQSAPIQPTSTNASSITSLSPSVSASSGSSSSPSPVPLYTRPMGLPNHPHQHNHMYTAVPVSRRASPMHNPTSPYYAPRRTAPPNQPTLLYNPSRPLVQRVPHGYRSTLSASPVYRPSSTPTMTHLPIPPLRPVEPTFTLAGPAAVEDRAWLKGLGLPLTTTLSRYSIQRIASGSSMEGKSATSNSSPVLPRLRYQSEPHPATVILPSLAPLIDYQILRAQSSATLTDCLPQASKANPLPSLASLF